MTENIDCNLSLGVTKAGKIGKDIYIGILSIDKDDELKLLINNLLYSNHLINITGKDDNSLPNSSLSGQIIQKYIAKMIRENSLQISLFRLQPLEQFKLLQEISTLEGKRLYDLGKKLDSSNYQYIGKAMQLRYQYPKLYYEAMVKSILQYYALTKVMRDYNCGHGKLFEENIQNERKMAIHVIVNGGSWYSSYQDLLNNNLKNYWDSIKTDQNSQFYWNLMVATHGIANAENYYPVVSSIDIIVKNLNDNLSSVVFTDSILEDIKAEELLTNENFVGQPLTEVLHEHYLERTGSTFRPPKLWRIGDFNCLDEYDCSLPYLMLQKSIKEKRITAREVDDDIDSIERFYQYNNPLERDAFLVGKINEKHLPIIELLKEQGVIGKTVHDDTLIEEFQTLLGRISDFIQCDSCIIRPTDREMILEKIDSMEKQTFEELEKIPTPELY
jgi:hypothetical protein